jgi:hypothetical protein
MTVLAQGDVNGGGRSVLRYYKGQELGVVDCLPDWGAAVLRPYKESQYDL